MTLNYLITKRKELNLSQKEVANHLNITQQHYSRIEKGLIDNTPYLNKLSKYLKCNKKDLILLGAGHANIEVIKYLGKM